MKKYLNNYRSEIISILALIVAIISTWTSIHYSKLNNKTNILPLLVFLYNEEEGWLLKNVGNGPALNITIVYQKHNETKWCKPTRSYPIENGVQINISWVGDNPNKLGVTYFDAYNKVYNSICDDDLTKIFHENILPVWKNSEVKRIWEQ